MKFAKRAGLVAALLGAMSGSIALAQDAYPSKPVTVIVPFAPGPTEQTARVIMDELSNRMGQNFLVETRPGAASLIGTQAVAAAEADGYTILYSSAITTIMMEITRGEQIEFSPLEDFVPVAKVINRPYVIYVDPNLGIDTVEELIQAAKEQPGVLAYSSSGVGSPTHLTSARFMQLAGIDMLHVPFNGSAPAIQAVVSGEVSIHFGGPSQYDQYATSGMLKALAVTDVVPFAQLPDVPTMADVLPEYVSAGSTDIFVRKGTPQEVIDLLHTNIMEVLQDETIRERLRTSGEPSDATPEEIAASMKEEAEMIRNLLVEQNIELE